MTDHAVETCHYCKCEAETWEQAHTAYFGVSPFRCSSALAEQLKSDFDEGNRCLYNINVGCFSANAVRTVLMVSIAA